MVFFSVDILWLLLAYVLGSAATYFLLYRKLFMSATEKTLDMLMNGGFLRYRINADGDTEILKWDEEETK